MSLSDRKSTRLNSSHGYISYAVFCLKKKKTIWILWRLPLLRTIRYLLLLPSRHHPLILYSSSVVSRPSHTAFAAADVSRHLHHIVLHMPAMHTIEVTVGIRTIVTLVAANLDRHVEHIDVEIAEVDLANERVVSRAQNVAALGLFFFFFNIPPPPEISPLPLHAALPLSAREHQDTPFRAVAFGPQLPRILAGTAPSLAIDDLQVFGLRAPQPAARDRLTRAFEELYAGSATGDRKSTRLNSSHGYISYAVFCLKKKKTLTPIYRATSDTPHPLDAAVDP